MFNILKTSPSAGQLYNAKPARAMVISSLPFNCCCSASSTTLLLPPPLHLHAGLRSSPHVSSMASLRPCFARFLNPPRHRSLPRHHISTVAFAVWKQEVLFAEAPVVSVDRAAEQLFHFVLDISANPELMTGHTKAGQFVQVKVGLSKPAFLAIASPPNTAAAGSLEFLIKYVEGSTAGLLCGLGRGDRVELSQVMGNGFAVERLSPADQFSTVLLFATGSGISPVRSLIEAGFDAHKRFDVKLYYGTRNLQRMAYQDKFEEWESSGVKIVPVLSQPGDDWAGERGYVQAAFARSKSISGPLQTGAVLCGHKEMAQDVTSILVSEGVQQDKILKNF